MLMLLQTVVVDSYWTCLVVECYHCVTIGLRSRRSDDIKETRCVSLGAQLPNIHQFLIPQLLVFCVFLCICFPKSNRYLWKKGVISEPGYIDNMIAFIITYILHLYTHDGCYIWTRKHCKRDRYHNVHVVVDEHA